MPHKAWSHLPESNRRPTRYECVALPTELRWQIPTDRIIIQAPAANLQTDTLEVYNTIKGVSDIMLTEFKKFILRGNVVDLAVAVVVGAAFNSVVQGVVKDLITPLIAAIGGERNFANLSFKLHVLNLVISFLIIAAVVFFLVVQPINKLQALANRSKSREEPTDRKCPECLSTIPKAAKRCAFCTAKVTPLTK
jgi:large conductance mechanosensitive channel